MSGPAGELVAMCVLVGAAVTFGVLAVASHRLREGFLVGLNVFGALVAIYGLAAMLRVI